MPRNKLTDLNNHLYATIESLYDGDMEVDRAKAICTVAGKIIEIKKVECQQAKLLLQAGYGDQVGRAILKLQSPVKDEEE